MPHQNQAETRLALPPSRLQTGWLEETGSTHARWATIADSHTTEVKPTSVHKHAPAVHHKPRKTPSPP